MTISGRPDVRQLRPSLPRTVPRSLGPRNYQLFSPIRLSLWPSRPPYRLIWAVTTMHENRLSAADKGDIGLTWQILSMESVTISAPVQQSADSPLRLGVLALHGLHDTVPLFTGSSIDHGSANDIRWVPGGSRSHGVGQLHRLSLPRLPHVDMRDCGTVSRYGQLCWRWATMGDRRHLNRAAADGTSDPAGLQCKRRSGCCAIHPTVG